MKKIIIFSGCLLCLMVLSTCNTAKKTTSGLTPKSAITPAPSSVAGDWSFLISNTPLGDVEGVMTLSTENMDKDWAGKMVTSQGTLPFQTIKVIDKTVTAIFDYDGVPVTLSLQFEQQDFAGKAMVSGYGDFPMKGQRKK